jgi:cobalt/nickel transport system permease protein
MHMADALLSPAVGGTMWVASAAAIACSSRRLDWELDAGKVPLMGVLAAFIFAAQMVNFTIPGTGSSGHLGGGMILAILLGPSAGFLAMASVLTVQALFFADGGLLALGCNIFNLGFIPCFIAYPFICRPLLGRHPTPARILAGAGSGAIVALQLGAFGVVVETLLSGISALPFTTFVLLIQPIHLAIGVVEGVVTAMVIGLVWRARPELLAPTSPRGRFAGNSRRRVLAGLLAATLVTGGGLCWFASGHPDGLEWAVSRASGQADLSSPAGGIHELLAGIQKKLAFLPGYGFRQVVGTGSGEAAAVAGADEEAWPAVKAGTSVAGLVGGGLTLLLAAGIGFMLRRRGLAAKHSHLSS